MSHAVPKFYPLRPHHKYGLRTNRAFWIILSIFLSVLFIDHLIDVLLNQGVPGREALQPYVIAYFYRPSFLIILGYLFLSSPKLFIQKSFLGIFVIWLVVFVLEILQKSYTGKGIDHFAIYSQISFFTVGYSIGCVLYSSEIRRLLNLSFVLCLIIIIYFTEVIYTTREFLYYGLLYIDKLRPQHAAGLIYSTELSNYLFQIFIIGLALITSGMNYSFPKYFNLLLHLMVLFLLWYIIILWSTATLICLIPILYFFTKETKSRFIKRIRWPIFILLIGILLSSEPVRNFTIALYDFKRFGEDTRVFRYIWLLEMIAKDPVWGTSSKMTWIPHQNILSAWAFGGIFRMIYYIGIIILNLFTFFALCKSKFNINDRTLFTIAYCSVFYWHFKGLIQDTFYRPEIYLWTGVLFGLYVSRPHLGKRDGLNPT